MNNWKSENQLAYEIQIKEVLQKAYSTFEQSNEVKAELDLLNSKVAEDIGVTFDQYRHQTLLELFSKKAQSMNKDHIDLAIEMILPPPQANVLKELRNQVINEMIQ